MRLSILIATVGRRNQKFLSLVKSLLEQIKDSDIEIVAYWNNGELPIGDIRQALLEEAKGEYVCFIDDDDKVPDWYCAEILKALGKDYVGFEVQLFEKDKLMPPSYHTIKTGIWHQDEKGYYRGVTHLNPIKRELALKGSFKGGIGEDEAWSRTVTPHVLTENYIDQIMYYYLHDADDTHFGGAFVPPQGYKRPIIASSHFRYHPKSKKVFKGAI